MEKMIWAFLWLTCTTVQVSAQSAPKASVGGFVYDAANGEALIGANVYIEGTLIGSSTNVSGYYVIPKVPPGSYTLVFHYIGYKVIKRDFAVAVGDEKTITVSLEEQNIELQKVIVTEDAIPNAEKLFEKPISKIELSARQIKQIPQVAEADLLRSLQTLPGILPLSDFSSALYVRGGTPDQNLNLLDGTDVYNPEHAFGIFSTFNTDAIKRVELSKGGFNAKYGGRLSSILDVTNLDGNREEFEASGAISLLSAKTTIQMPLGKIGSLSGSFRRTYFDKTIAKAIDNVPDYYFYDGNVKAFFDLDARNKLTVSAYGGEDQLDFTLNEGVDDEASLTYDWGNRTGSIRWTRILSPRLFGNFWVTGSRFDSDFDFGETIDITEKNFVSDFTFKGSLDLYHSERLTSSFGFEQKNLHLIFRQGFPGGKINVDNRPRHYVLYLHESWRPTYRWDIEAGLRFNLFDTDETFRNLAPRFSAKYRLSDSVNLKAAGGVYYQYLHRIPRAFVADIWFSSNRFQKESSSSHLIAGISKDLANSFQLEVEAFYKDYSNIYSFNQLVATELIADEFENGEPIYTKTRGVFNRGDGESAGIEMLLRKERGAVTGWLAYSLASTKYTTDNINRGVSFAPRHDRRHAVNVVANIDWKNLKRSWRGQAPMRHKSNWKFGMTFIYTTGQPITLPGSAYFINALPDRPVNEYELFPRAINDLRLPAYARLDLSITYERHFRSWSMYPYLQIFNIGNRKNVWFVDYDNIFGEPDIDVQQMFPILPTVGVSFEF